MISIRLVLCIFAATIPQVACAEPLLRYTFDEAGGDALDSGDAPSANAALLGGAVRSTNTPSGFGSSLDLRDGDGTFAHALAGDADKLDGMTALTLTTWLNVESYTGGAGTFNRLISKQAPGNFGGFSWNMNDTPNTGIVGPDNFRLGIFLGNAATGDFNGGFSTDDVDGHNKWVFLAVTYEGAQAVDNTKFYVGGVNSPVTQLGNAITIPQMLIDGGTAPIGVGYTAASVSDLSVVGFQDDVRVYGRALNLSEVESVRTEGLVPEPVSILGLLIAPMAFYRPRFRKRKI